MFKRSGLIFFLILALMLPKIVFAETSNLLAEPTKPKDIAFTFYRLAGLKPDFAPLIQSTSAYQNADEATKAKMLTEDKAKMDQEFNSLNPKARAIVVRSAVQLKMNLGAPAGMTLNFPEHTGPIYFAYQWAGENFAVIPNKIDSFVTIPLKMAEASAVSARLDSGGNATMVLELLPLSTDSNRPMRLDGLDQWLMMTNIVSISFYNQYLQTIWSWDAPGYKRPEQKPLLDLKR